MSDRNHLNIYDRSILQHYVNSKVSIRKIAITLIIAVYNQPGAKTQLYSQYQFYRYTEIAVVIMDLSVISIFSAS